MVHVKALRLWKPKGGVSTTPLEALPVQCHRVDSLPRDTFKWAFQLTRTNMKDRWVWIWIMRLSLHCWWWILNFVVDPPTSTVRARIVCTCVSVCLYLCVCAWSLVGPDTYCPYSFSFQFSFLRACVCGGGGGGAGMDVITFYYQCFFFPSSSFFFPRQPNSEYDWLTPNQICCSINVHRYQASEWGWSNAKKRAEMREEGTFYLVVGGQGQEVSVCMPQD